MTADFRYDRGRLRFGSISHSPGQNGRAYKPFEKNGHLPAGTSAPPWQIFPSAYPIAITEEFDACFCQDPNALPPAELRRQLWEKLVAEPTRERQLAAARREAEARYTEEMEDYQYASDAHDRHLRDVTLLNEGIQHRNEERAAKYEADKANFEKRPNELKARLRQRLDRIIVRQRPLLRRINRQSRRRAAVRTIFSTTCLFWMFTLAVYASLLASHPQIAPIAGVVSLLTSYVLRLQHGHYVTEALYDVYGTWPQLWVGSKGMGLPVEAQKAAAKKLSRTLWSVSLIFYGWLYLSYPFHDLIPPALLLVLCGLAFLRFVLRRPWKCEVPKPKSATCRFQPYYNKSRRRIKGIVYTPVYFYFGDEGSPLDEGCPFDPMGIHYPGYFHFLSVIIIAMVFVPNTSIPVILCTLFAFICRLTGLSTPLRVRSAAKRRRALLLAEFDSQLRRSRVIEYLRRTKRMPKPPVKEPLLPLPIAPAPPTNKILLPPEPHPPEIDDEAEENHTHILRGSRVFSAGQIARLARQALFSHNQVRPFLPFGAVPVPLLEQQSPHLICIGTTGSGKTTILKTLMSAVMPLTSRQAERIHSQSAKIGRPLPSSSHEWSRSCTYQAVVYNSKSENIPFLASLGFDPTSDLIILDPADERCVAWDVARDINDRDSVSQFADLFVPVIKGDRGKDDKIWEDVARRLIKAVIISLRNAAFAQGKEPSWTLRDLCRAVETPSRLAEVLRYYDIPDQVKSQLLDLAESQSSSVYMSACNYIAKFDEIGERWDEAKRQGRSISLKDWAKKHRGSVLVLPNTPSNPDVYEPLNRVVFKALTNITLDEEYSCLKDESGKKHFKNRYFFIDELGTAGKLVDLDRLMSEGRSFGVHVVLGVHQLSQLRRTYGPDDADTILGLCPYLALLKTSDPATAEWMGKRVGDTLRTYNKKSHAYGTADTTSMTKTTNTQATDTHGKNQSRSKGTSEGTNENQGTGSAKHPYSPSSWSANYSKGKNRSTTDQDTQGTNESRAETKGSSDAQGNSHTDNQTTTDSQDIRHEAALFQSEFLNLPDPSSTGIVAGYFITPSFPVWKAEIPFSKLQPRLECPDDEHVTPAVKKWREQERVSKIKPWTGEDFKRLSLDIPMPKKPREKRNFGDNDGQLPADFDF